jgi:hypothetical protein
MKLILVIALLSSVSVFAKDNAILEVNPYSADSIEKHFPNAVKTDTIIDQGPRDYIKRVGPKTTTQKTVNYDVLVPALIETIQNQQREIASLKAGK